MIEPAAISAYTGQRPNYLNRDHRPQTLSTTVIAPEGVLPIPHNAPRKETNYFMGRPVHPNYTYKRTRRFAGDENIPYPLPCDQDEVNRQNMRHHLYSEIFGATHAAEFPNKEDIPSKVLDVGCGSGLWISALADEFAALGRPDVQFTGLDIVRSCPEMLGVNFKFVRHNLLSLPLPFADGEFEYVMVREMTFCYPSDRSSEGLLEEYLRILKFGGILEVQCSDPMIRCLSPSGVPPSLRSGAYPINSMTRFASDSKNTYIQEWNKYIKAFCSIHKLHLAPCTTVHSTLLMEARRLGNIRYRRYALPLDNPSWERELVSARPSSSNTPVKRSLTPSLIADGRRSNERSPSHSPSRAGTTDMLTMGDQFATSKPSPADKFISEDAKALRMLARQNFTEMIRNLEPVLRQTNKIPQEDWDWWYRDLMLNFHTNRGLTGGECMEFGAWWGVKKK